MRDIIPNSEFKVGILDVGSGTSLNLIS